MLRKYSVLLATGIALLLLLVATYHYPGGSQFDKSSIGYNWSTNYLCNLFSENAENGATNDSKPWAIAGMLFLCTAFAIFFIEFSKKIIVKHAANMIRYAGAASMFFAFLIVTPLHNQMITVAGALALLSMFYITVFVFKSKLVLFKVFSVICLAAAYACNYVYYTDNHLALLPVLQKVALFITITWILLLHYFTTAADFAPANNTDIAAAAALEKE